MDAAGAEKIEYFIIFIIFQHRRLPRREAFGATFLESLERVAHLEFWENGLGRASLSRPEERSGGFSQIFRQDGSWEKCFRRFWEISVAESLARAGRPSKAY